MSPGENEVVAALVRFAGALGVRLPCDVTELLREALQWAGIIPLRNSLTPGVVPLEYSFSTWQPEEFRMAAQLFATLAASERRARTLALVEQLTNRYLPAGPASRDTWAPPLTSPKRFGAFFGMTAGLNGLTGTEAYLEAVQGEDRLSWLPDPLFRALEPGLRPVFTGIGIRDGVVGRRAYLAVTGDLETTILCKALLTCGPSVQVNSVLASLRELVGRRHVLPAGTVMVTSTDDASMWSVELQAASYGVDVVSLPTRLAALRNVAFGRWAMAIGGPRAGATVVSMRFSERLGPGIAVYAVPAWIRQPPSLTPGPVACPPSTEPGAFSWQSIQT